MDLHELSKEIERQKQWIPTNDWVVGYDPYQPYSGNSTITYTQGTNVTLGGSLNTQTLINKPTVSTTGLTTTGGYYYATNGISTTAR